MLERFESFVREQQLFDRSHRLLVGVSGGVDSVVLCYLLKEGGYTFSIVHCNFQLRGDDSDADEAFVQELANTLEVGFFTKRFATKEEVGKSGESTQMVARSLRYAWFEELMQGEFDGFLTAHHLDDDLETFLLNFSRGTGIKGLTGISAKRGAYRRPLLFASKDEIRSFAQANTIFWREDDSNEKVDYDRNFIRHRIVPLFEELNPSTRQTFRRTLKRVQASNSLVEYSLRQFEQDHVREKETGFDIRREGLKTSPSPLAVLLHLLEPLGFRFDQCVQMLEKLEGQPGGQFFAGTQEVTLDRDWLFVREVQEVEFDPISLDSEEGSLSLEQGSFQWEKVAVEEVDFSFSEQHAFVDVERLQFPLVLRQWKEGDRLVPLGMNGQKKVSDLLVDLKVPRNEKHQVKVLESGGRVVWVVGLRLDDRFKVTSDTQFCLHFYFGA